MEEDHDDLPPVLVSPGSDKGVFTIPRAAEVAERRSHARRVEAELCALRGGGGGVPRSDSSSSEGELAAAVSALAVRGAHRRVPPRPLAHLARDAAAGHRLQGAAPLLGEYARAPPGRAALASRTLARLEGAVAGAEGAPCEQEAAAWLWLGLAARERRQVSAARLARAGHALESRRAYASLTLADALLAALPAPRARLDLADAVRAGGDACAPLADRLASVTLLDVLGVADSQDEAAWHAAAARRWAALPPREQLAALGAATRLRAHGSSARWAERSRRLLEAAPVPRDARPDPDSFQVQIVASKLQVLFPAKKNEPLTESRNEDSSKT